MNRRHILNTARHEVRPDWVMGGNPDAIRRQEKDGQDALVNSEQLPTDVRGDKSLLEKAGVVFGKPLAGDKLFCRATLPNGWQKRATDHSMWSELVDDGGVVVANIFYKAAFYDREAFIRVKE